MPGRKAKAAGGEPNSLVLLGSAPRALRRDGKLAGAPRRTRGAAAEREHLRQRRLVERVAEALFADRGYRGTSIHLVAARSHCSVGHLYNLYGNKLGLYSALLEAKMDKLRDVVDQALAADAPARRRLSELVVMVLRFFEENSAFFRIYATETGIRLWRSNLPFIDRIGEWHDQVLARITALVQEGQEKGEFRTGIDPRLVAVSLIGMAKGHTTEWVLEGEEGSLLDRADGILNLSLDGLCIRREMI